MTTLEKLFVICIMTTYGKSWRPTGRSPRRERVKIENHLNKRKPE